MDGAQGSKKEILLNMQSNPASEAVRNAVLEFINSDLVKVVHNIHSGDELSVHPTWEFQLRRQTAEWLAGGGQGSGVV